MYPDGRADKHLANVLATLAVELADQIAVATEAAAGLGGEVPAAVMALSQFLDGSTIQQLARVVGLTHSGAVRLVTRLEAAQLAARTPGPDGRSQSIQLTTGGRIVARRISEARADVIGAVLVDLEPAERRRLAPVVDTMVATVTARRLDARREGVEPRGWLCRLCDFGDCDRTAGHCPAAGTAATTRE